MKTTNMNLHKICTLALFLSIVAVILGGMGTKAYHDIDHNPDEHMEINDLTVNGQITGVHKYKYITTTDNKNYKDLEKGDYTILVNAALANNSYIRLPEATTSNGGMHIQIIFSLAPAGLAKIGFVKTNIIGGATVVSDATEGAASANNALVSSAISASNKCVVLDVDSTTRAGGYPGTVLDFYYTGVNNTVVHNAWLIGDVDSATITDYFSSVEVNA